MPKPPAPDTLSDMAAAVAEQQAVTAGMAAALEYARGGPSPWASEADMAADIAALLDAAPSFRAELGKAATGKTRYRARSKEDAARRAAEMRFPDGIPRPAVLPRKDLCAIICDYAIEHGLIAAKAGGARKPISDDTIKIALGLKKRRRR